MEFFQKPYYWNCNKGQEYGNGKGQYNRRSKIEDCRKKDDGDYRQEKKINPARIKMTSSFFSHNTPLNIINII